MAMLGQVNCMMEQHMTNKGRNMMEQQVANKGRSN
jgi:hypothetical protein